jgi:hypothetical protein
VTWTWRRRAKSKIKPFLVNVLGEAEPTTIAVPLATRQGQPQETRLGSHLNVVVRRADWDRQIVHETPQWLIVSEWLLALIGDGSAQASEGWRGYGDCAIIGCIQLRLERGICVPVIPTKTERAFKRFRQRVRQVPMGSGLEWFHETLVKLADDGFLVADWLSAFELAAVAKYVVLFGTPHGTKQWLDLARVLNPYKDFWAAAESENPYASDDQFLGTFIFRLVYQQLPFLVFPERVQSLFAGARDLYLPDAATTKQFERLTKIPLAAFFGVAEKLYVPFRERASATTDILRGALSGVDPIYVEAVMKVICATAAQFDQLYQKTHAQSLAEKPYEFNPLLRYPVIRLGPRFYAPFPELIAYATTRGLYFHLLDEIGNEFSEAFASAFECYSARLVRAKLGESVVLTEEEERSAGWHGKTNDFTVFDQDKAALFECKTSGLFFSSKSRASVADLQTDIRKNLANPKDRSGLFQLYDKLQAIKEKRLPSALMARYAPAKEFYPVIILYDRIQFANTPAVLGNLLQGELRAAGITGFDFQIWHIEEVENLCELLPRDEFIRVVAKKFATARLHDQDLNAYLYSRIQRRYLHPHLFVTQGRRPRLANTKIARGATTAGLKPLSEPPVTRTTTLQMDAPPFFAAESPSGKLPAPITRE